MGLCCRGFGCHEVGQSEMGDGSVQCHGFVIAGVGCGCACRCGRGLPFGS